jgi:chromosome segregation ATPase
MPDGFNVSRDFSDPALINAVRSELWPDSLELLARLRRRVAENRRALEAHANEFDKAYEEATRNGLDANGLVQLAGTVLEAERGAAEQLHPWMEALIERLEPQSERAREAQQHLHELHELAVAWLAAYQTLRERLLKLASERRDISGKVLRARPVDGDIDYTELSREHLSRYPKIRAALAK